jgi:hypothetical protein
MILEQDPLHTFQQPYKLKLIQHLKLEIKNTLNTFKVKRRDKNLRQKSRGKTSQIYRKKD